MYGVTCSLYFRLLLFMKWAIVDLSDVFFLLFIYLNILSFWMFLETLIWLLLNCLFIINPFCHFIRYLYFLFKKWFDQLQGASVDEGSHASLSTKARGQFYGLAGVSLGQVSYYLSPGFMLNPDVLRDNLVSKGGILMACRVISVIWDCWNSRWSYV